MRHRYARGSSPRSSGDRASASGAVCAGSNPAEGADLERSPLVDPQAFENAATQDIRKMAISEGMKTLYDDGIRKVLTGLTTLEEVYRVAKQTESDTAAA